MPEAQAAAPAAAAEPAATAATPVAAEPAKPHASPKRGEARHDEIRAKLAAAKPSVGTAKPGENVTVEGGTAAIEAKPVATPEPEKPKPAVGAVMRLTAENTKLQGRIDELTTKLEAASKGETVESLRAKVKKDPAVLLDTFGADLDEDETKRLVKFNDAVLGRSDPAYAKDREIRSEVDELKKQIAERDAALATSNSKDRDARARTHTATILTEGHKADDGTLVIDPAKFPYVNHLTKAGEIDAHAGVMHATREMATDFRTKQGREPTDAEIINMIGIAASEAEAYFAKRAKNWSLPAAPVAAAETDEDAPAERKTPTTIGSGFGSNRAGTVDKKQLSKAEKHELIRDRLRKASAQSPSVN